MNELGILIAAHIPCLVMMIVGYALLVVEMYIPGFGLAGISGTILMIGGIALMQPTPLQLLILIFVSVVLLGIAFSIAMHSIAKGRLSRSDLVLNEVLNGKEQEEVNELTYFIGKTGTTHTPCRPIGVAEFDGVRLNVDADGDFIDKDVPVEIVRVEGKRIIIAKRS